MQYWRLVRGLPGLLPLSRFQIGMGIFMYLAALAWTVMIVLSALKVFDPEVGAIEITLGIWLFAVSFLITMMPKLMGMLDVVFTPGAMSRYGGPLRFLASSLTEIVFSIMLSPIAAVRLTHLHAQPAVRPQRHLERPAARRASAELDHGAEGHVAADAVRPGDLRAAELEGAGRAALGRAAAVGPYPGGAVRRAHRLAARRRGSWRELGLCGIPEERVVPRDLRAFTDPDIRQGDPDSPAGPSGQFAPAPAN